MIYESSPSNFTGMQRISILESTKLAPRLTWNPAFAAARYLSYWILRKNLSFVSDSKHHKALDANNSSRCLRRMLSLARLGDNICVTSQWLSQSENQRGRSSRQGCQNNGRPTKLIPDSISHVATIYNWLSTICFSIPTKMSDTQASWLVIGWHVVCVGTAVSIG